MSALKKKVSVETEFLREFARSPETEVGFTPKVELQMRVQMVSLTGVHQVMRTGEVVLSEKDSAECSMWVVVGETSNNDELRIMLEVVYDRYRMTVTDVRKK